MGRRRHRLVLLAEFSPHDKLGSAPAGTLAGRAHAHFPASQRPPRRGPRALPRQNEDVHAVKESKHNSGRRKEGGEPPCHAPEPLEGAGNAGNAVGRAALGKLSSAQLYTILQLKKVPGRSKLRAKGTRINALAGVATRADLRAVGALPAGPAPAEPALAPSPLPAPFCPRPSYGARLDAPVVGIDVDAETLVCAVATETGLGEGTVVPNTREGARALVAFCATHGAAHAALESTAEYWLVAYWTLVEAGIEVLVANPRQTKATQGRKTDRHDARRIALARRDGRLKPSVPCTPAEYERRKLSRLAIKKVQQGAQAVTRLKSLLHATSAPRWVTKLHQSARGRQIWARCLPLAPASPGAVLAILTEEYARGPHVITGLEELATRAGSLAGVLAALPPPCRVRLAFHLEEHASCQAAAKKLRLQVLQHAGRDERFRADLELLVGIPGVGVGLALTILVEVIDARHFWGAKALVRWAGLNPKVRQSGHRKRANGAISKMGNKYLRWACWNAARNDYAHAGREGHPIGAFARRLAQERGKPYKAAVTAAARKLLAYIYHVLAQRRPFAELCGEEACEHAEENRLRKVRSLERALSHAAVADLLPALVSAFERSSEQLDEASQALAEEARRWIDFEISVPAE